MENKKKIKILWVGKSHLKFEERLSCYHLSKAETIAEAQFKLLKANHAIVIANYNESSDDAISFLQWVESNSDATIRILFIEELASDILIRAINEATVFYIMNPQTEDEEVQKVTEGAIYYHKSQMQRSSLLREVQSQNKQLEKMTGDLEEIVADRTSSIEKSNIEAREKLNRMKQLNRFVMDLSHRTNIEELLKLLKKEIRSFHKVGEPLLIYRSGSEEYRLVTFRRSQIVSQIIEGFQPRSKNLRINDSQDSYYLANLLGKPVTKTIAIPLKISGSKEEREVVSELYIEHSLEEGEIELFIEFISARLQPLNIAFDRILLEYQMKNASYQWSKTFDNIQDPIAIVDLDLNIVRSNAIFLKNEKKVQCYASFAKNSQQCSGCPVKEAHRTGKPQMGQIVVEGRIYEVLSDPILQKKDLQPTNFVNYYVDITSSRKLYSQVIQNEKMSAIGLLAGNIAHELNNPLTGIRSLSQVLQREVQENSEIQEDLKEVEKAAQRSQGIIKNLIEFSDNEEKSSQTISLKEIVERTIPMLKTVMSYHRSEVSLSESGLVNVEPQLMQQVVFNLVNNACQAMEEGGHLEISTQIEERDGKQWGVLKVKDNGPGISKYNISHIFEPFFTTKQKGQGTGLGLSMSKSIVEKYGGNIYVESEIDQGTEFSIHLPQHSPE